MASRHQHWQPKELREIVERVLIEGDLELLSPAHFGSGDADRRGAAQLLAGAHGGR